MASLTREQLRDLYRFLLLTRGLEERLERLRADGRLVGDLYRSLGQEATAVGSAFALAEGDWLAPSTRDLGALLVRGLPPREILLQLMGRADSPSAGKDNEHHFTIPELGLLGPVGPLGNHLCVLNGIALALRMRGEPHVGMTYLGEGATRTGAAHEGLNFAAVQRLPIVVIIEHNGWAFSTPSAHQAAVADWLDVASAYGVPAAAVDGNDALAVFDESRRAVDRARRGDGLTIIVAETYRMLGHSQDDTHDYMPQSELERWRARDPVRGLETYLVETGFESRAALAVVKEGVRRELEAVVEDTRSAPLPEGGKARTGTVDGETLSVPWTRREAVYHDLPDQSAPLEAGSA